MTPPSAAVRVGDEAPPLRGRTAEGKPFDLAEARPRPFLVEFHRGTW